MKPIHFIRLIIVISLMTHVNLLFTQTGYPASFCDTTIEDFCEVFGYATTLDPRYGIERECPDFTTSPFPTTEGDSACTDEFLGYWTKLADADFHGQLNGERSAWNKDSDIAFFRGPGNDEITFFDQNGDKLSSHTFTSSDFYTTPPSGFDWQDKLSTIRWDPIRDVIFYPKEHQLIKRSISVSGTTVTVGVPKILASFPGMTIGMSYGAPYRIAGGDGNDVNAGRFLISLVRGATTYFVVYDFNEDALITQKVKADSTTSYSENTHALFAFQRQAPGFDESFLPNHPIVKKWWAYMADIMETHPDHSPVAKDLVEVFHVA
jgi:L-rhamnose mutarotase